MISLPCPVSIDAYSDGDNARSTRANVRPWRAITTRALASSVGCVYIHFTGRRDAAHKKAAKMTAEISTFTVRNHSDEAETDAWTCQATSSVDAAHQYLAAF